MIGQTISHYHIKEKLGQGGMGVVYKAEDTRLKRAVALKFIETGAFDSDESKTRFVSEAQIAASLNHPHINTVYEIDEADSRTFIAMEYIEGQTLKQMLRSAPLKLEDALDIAIQVSEGLIEAHDKGIVHRDIKSSNIMVTSKGQAKIMDFGLARYSGETRVTRTSTIVGTVAFMSPEQATGEILDQRADIWSLGVVLFQMITGQLPFKGNQAQLILYAILNEEPHALTGIRSGIPLELEMIVNRCLEKDPDARYQTVADLQADLKRLVRDLGTGRLYSTQMKRRPQKRIRKRPWKIVFPMAAVLALIAVVLVVPAIRDPLAIRLGFRPIPEARYLAILPFTVNADDPQLKQVCNGLVETLTNKLAQLESFQESLQVAPSNDVIGMRIDSATGAREELGVNLVITGQMVSVLDSIKLMLSLTETDPPRQLRSRDIEVTRSDLHTLYEKSVYAVVEMLALETRPEMSTILDSEGTKDPDAWIYYMEGRGILQQDASDSDLDRSIALFRKAIGRDPNYALAYDGLGNAYWEKWGKTKDSLWAEQARAACQQGLEIDPNQPVIHLSLGMFANETGDYENAITHIRKALEIDPTSAGAHLNLAFVFERIGRLQDAEQEYIRAVELRPDYWRGYRYLGVFYFYQGRYDEAEKTFQKIVALTPNRANAYNLLGIVYLRQGRSDLAIERFEESLRIEPNYTAYSNLGTIYFFMEKDYEKARDMFEQASRVNPDIYTIMANLGDAYRYLDDKRKAEESYKKAISLAEKELRVKKKDAELLSRLGRYYALTGETGKARSYASQAKDLAPSNVEVLIVCAKVFEFLEERSAALNCLRDIMRLGGSWTDIEQSPDFEELRKDPRYQRLLKK